MAYTADNLAYDVITDLSSRELMKGPVWILGKKYILPKDKEAINSDIKSKLWCTYRKNFRPISGTNLSSDTGWGCTLRCGQMLLAQTLLQKEFDKGDYKWIPNNDDPRYNKILKKFLDVRDSEYSIQMIALQGADFGRQVGQWFGPNNVAQAIKKLVAHDDDSQLAVHVAMDMLVVIDDLKATAYEPHGFPESSINVTNEKGENIVRSHSLTDCATHGFPPDKSTPSSYGPDSSYFNTCLSTSSGEGVVFSDSPVTSSSPFYNKTFPIVANNPTDTTGISFLGDSPVTNHLVVGDESMDFMKLSLRQYHAPPPVRRSASESPSKKLRTISSPPLGDGRKFRPLLLFIPLRLGQDSFNSDYQDALKACLTLPQSVGFIGGRPRHAQYFIGYNNNNLLFLDPHTTQQTVQVKEGGAIPDSTYHCSTYGHMCVSGLDPSIALGFFCRNERDLDDLVNRLQKFVLKDSCLNMFELTKNRPSYWGPMEPFSPQASIREPFLLISEEDTDFEDFEIISWPLTTYYNQISPPPLPTSIDPALRPPPLSEMKDMSDNSY